MDPLVGDSHSKGFGAESPPSAGGALPGFEEAVETLAFQVRILAPDPPLQHGCQSGPGDFMPPHFQRQGDSFVSESMQQRVDNGRVEVASRVAGLEAEVPLHSVKPDER